MAGAVPVSHDDASIVCHEMEFEDITHISSGVGRVEVRSAGRGSDGDDFGRGQCCKAQDGAWRSGVLHVVRLHSLGKLAEATLKTQWRLDCLICRWLVSSGSTRCLWNST